MRILLISGDYPPTISGIGDYTYLLAQHLEKLGHDVCVLSSAGDAGEFKDGNVQVYRKIESWDESLWPYLENLVLEWKPEIVHIQFHTCSFERKWFIHLLPMRLCRYFSHLRIFTTYHEFAAPWKRIALIPMFLGSHRNIVTNDRDYKRFSWIPPFFLRKKLAYVPLFSNIHPEMISDDRKESVRSGLNLDGKESLILRFGFIHQQALTQITTILKAMQQLKESGMHLKLLLLGKQEEDTLEPLRMKVEELGLVDEVRVIGEVSASEVSAYLHSADIAVAPYADGVSERRGAFLAALTHGLPVLTTKKGHFPANLKHAENVYAIKHANNPKEWSKALKTLIEDVALRNRISEAAREMQAIYNPENVSREVTKHYKGSLS